MHQLLIANHSMDLIPTRCLTRQNGRTAEAWTGTAWSACPAHRPDPRATGSAGLRLRQRMAYPSPQSGSCRCKSLQSRRSSPCCARLTPISLPPWWSGACQSGERDFSPQLGYRPKIQIMAISGQPTLKWKLFIPLLITTVVARRYAIGNKASLGDVLFSRSYFDHLSSCSYSCYILKLGTKEELNPCPWTDFCLNHKNNQVVNGIPFVAPAAFPGRRTTVNRNWNRKWILRIGDMSWPHESNVCCVLGHDMLVAKSQNC